MVYVIRWTWDQWNHALANLEAIKDATAKSHPEVSEWAVEVLGMLEHEVEYPLQQAAERAEALGDESDV